MAGILGDKWSFAAQDRWTSWAERLFAGIAPSFGSPAELVGTKAAHGQIALLKSRFQGIQPDTRMMK